jgi:hypothetical protein
MQKNVTQWQREQMRAHKKILWIGLALGALLSSSLARAQELEPRAYSPAPVGTNFAILGYAHSSGDVALNPSLPFTDTKAQINSYYLGYARTFSLAGQSANVAAYMPYIRGDVTSMAGSTPIDVHRSGFADAKFRIGMSLLGGDALTPQEFSKREPATVLGTSLTVVAPTGQYEAPRLLNIGANRWAFKPEIGVSQPIGNWFLEGAVGMWLFTDNTDFLGTKERGQKPLAAYQAHVGYTFRPGLWLAVDATFYKGGETSVNGVDSQDRQESSRYGATLSIPIDRSWSAKVAWTNNYSIRVGQDFNTTSLAIQYRWFDR